MKIKVSIAGVDGQTNVSIECAAATPALDFLRAHDHEGSCTYIEVSSSDPEKGYELLRYVLRIEETWKRNA